MIGKQGIRGSIAAPGKGLHRGLQSLGKGSLIDNLYRHHMAGMYPKGMYSNGVGDAISNAATIGQNFLGQTHKAQAFQNVNNNPNVNHSHLPFEGKVASQLQSDVISGRKHPLQVINTSRDIESRISHPSWKDRYEQHSNFNHKPYKGLKRGALNSAPPFFGHNKRHKKALNQRNLPNSVSTGEANLYSYLAQSSIMPTVTTSQAAEMHGRAKI
jgi:hypothetical protein